MEGINTVTLKSLISIAPLFLHESLEVLGVSKALLDLSSVTCSIEDSLLA